MPAAAHINRWNMVRAAALLPGLLLMACSEANSVDASAQTIAAQVAAAEAAAVRAEAAQAAAEKALARMGQQPVDATFDTSESSAVVAGSETTAGPDLNDAHDDEVAPDVDTEAGFTGYSRTKPS